MRVVLRAAQRKTLRFMDGASLFLQKKSCTTFAQSAKSAKLYFCADFVHFVSFKGIYILFAETKDR